MSVLPSKPEMNREIALLFCRVCDGAYQAWVTHKYLFDQNDNKPNTIQKAAAFTERSRRRGYQRFPGRSNNGTDCSGPKAHNPWSGKVITARLPLVGSFGEPDVKRPKEEAML